jgi:DNA repair exonuclease SbcCD ATPase subunit
MVESKRKKVVKADLVTMKNEIRVLRVKIDKEQEKVNHLSENLEASKKHKTQIDTNNNALKQSNMLLIKKMTKIDEQMDEVVGHAQIVRVNGRKGHPSLSTNPS